MNEKNLAKKVGQLLIAGLPGPVLDKRQQKFLEESGLGGVILFKRNFESLPQLVELSNAVQKAVSTDSFSELPAWVAVDQEGGRVQRFGAPFTSFPPAAEWGAIASPKTCFEAGFVMGKELRAAGVN